MLQVVLDAIKGMISDFATSPACSLCISFICHGTEDGVQLEDGSVMSVMQIVKNFQVEQLAGIPKLFIFDICRGGTVVLKIIFFSIPPFHPKTIFAAIYYPFFFWLRTYTYIYMVISGGDCNVYDQLDVCVHPPPDLQPPIMNIVCTMA